MKSLHKSIDILEFVLNREGVPQTPSAVAEGCGVNVVTATRILGELTKRSYLRRISRNQGYVPGPVVYALADRRCDYGCIVHAASEVLKELAIRLDIQVNISVLDGTRRYILFHYSASRERNVMRQTSHVGDFYHTGTGRVLMAYADDKTVDKIIDEIGLPGENWPEVRSRRDLDMHLKRIRKAGQAEFKRQRNLEEHPLMVYGKALVMDGVPVCAIGTSVNANRPEQNIMDEFAVAVESIKRNILIQQKTY